MGKTTTPKPPQIPSIPGNDGIESGIGINVGTNWLSDLQSNITIPNWFPEFTIPEWMNPIDDSDDSSFDWGDYQSQQEGPIEYDKIVPPTQKLDQLSDKNKELHGNLIGSPYSPDDLNTVGQFYADLVGDTDWRPDTVLQDLEGFGSTDTRNFADIYGPGFQREVKDWKDDWGDDLFGQGNADYKSHGIDRALNVDLPYINAVEADIRDVVSSLGINKTGLVSSIYGEYGKEPDPSVLDAFISDPDQFKQFFTMGDEQLGAAGEYKVKIDNLEETFKLNKKQAKEALETSLEGVKDEKRAAAAEIRKQFSPSQSGLGRSAIRRGGRRGMGTTRSERAVISRQMKNLDEKREAARKSYEDKWGSGGSEVQNKECQESSAESMFNNLIVNDLTTLRSEIEGERLSIDLKSKQQEEKRYNDLMDALTFVGGMSPTALFPQPDEDG